MTSGIAKQVRRQGLTLMYAHVLPEIVVTAEIFPTSLNGTLVRCNEKVKNRTKERRSQYARFSLV